MKILTLKFEVGDRVKIQTANGAKLATVRKIEGRKVLVSIPIGKGVNLNEWIVK